MHRDKDRHHGQGHKPNADAASKYGSKDIGNRIIAIYRHGKRSFYFDCIRFLYNYMFITKTKLLLLITKNVPYKNVPK